MGWPDAPWPERSGGGVTAQGRQVFRAPAGSWAIRFYDAAGQRCQRNGFRTRDEARTALNEQLRRARLGPLHRPQVTLNELADAYLAQYDAAPTTVVRTRKRRRREPENSSSSGYGARRDRTADLLLAKQALSQLSYGPGTDESRDPLLSGKAFGSRAAV